MREQIDEILFDFFRGELTYEDATDKIIELHESELEKLQEIKIEVVEVKKKWWEFFKQ
jgi:hypothetical protein